MKPNSDTLTLTRGALQATALAAAVALTAAFAGQAHAQGKNGGGSTSSTAGVITIDQAKAEAGGVTPGDAPGFPVTISQPGSYRLMGNLTVTDPNVNAIEITANDVTLDLNGFAIVGPVVCTYGTPWSCAPNSGTGHGIAVVGSNQMGNVAIANGTVRGMGASGIWLNGTKVGSLIDRVRVIGNRQNGIAAGGALVTNSVAIRNGGNGISGDSLNVHASHLLWNGGYGLATNYVSGYGDNVLVGNALGNVSSGGARPTSGNLCNGLPCQ